MSRVPAAHLAPQLRALMDAGHSTAAIEAVTGVSRATVLNILSGRVNAVQPATARELTRATPAALTRATPSTNVPALGTTRRVRALRAAGWTAREIAAGTGVSESALSHLALGHHRVIHRDIAWAIASWYADHWRVRSLEGLTGHARAAAVTARRVARANGWVVGAAWENIDDPDEHPDAGTPEDGRAGIAVEDVEWLVRHERVTWVLLEDRLGYDAKSIKRALHRAGRGDLLRRVTETSEEAA